MGSAPSGPLSPSRPALSHDDVCRLQNGYEQQARMMLSRTPLILPLKRRRARSVGLPEENGTFWVYWRPDHQNRRH